MDWMIQGSIAGTGTFFLFSKMSGLALGFTQPPVASSKIITHITKNPKTPLNYYTEITD
jgi:hypothetical protein